MSAAGLKTALAHNGLTLDALVALGEQDAFARKSELLAFFAGS